MPASAPQRFGPYAVVRELGRGAMGIVFEAVHSQSGERVALKILLGQAAADAVLRFEREAAALARVDHPGLLAVHAIGTADTPPWIAMEFIDGESLRARLNASPEGRLAPAEVLEQGIALSDALAACHRERLVHRDVKPANVLLDRAGRVVLGDFGLARSQGSDGSTDDALGAGTLTATGHVVGTPITMAPEQFDPGSYGRPGPGADVWGLAATLYMALCGRPPFPGKTHLAILTEIQSGPPPAPDALRPDAPTWLADLLLEALTVDPNRRLDMEQLHDRLLAGESGAPRRRPGLALRSAGALVPAALLVLLAIGGGRAAGLDLRPIAWRETPTLVTALEDGADGQAIWRALAERRARLNADQRARVLTVLRERVAARGPSASGEVGPAGEDFAALIRLEAGDPALRDSEVRRPADWLRFRPLTAEALAVLEPVAFEPGHRRTLAKLIDEGVIAALSPANRLRWRARLLELSAQPGAALELLGEALKSSSPPAAEDDKTLDAALAQAARMAFRYRRDALAAELLDRLLKRRDASGSSSSSTVESMDAITDRVDTVELVTLRARLHLRLGETEDAAALIRRWRDRWPSPVWSVEQSAARHTSPPWQIPDLPPARDALLEAMIRRRRAELEFTLWITNDLVAFRESLLRLRLSTPGDITVAGRECNLCLLLSDGEAARRRITELARRHPDVPILRVQQAAMALVFGDKDRALELLESVPEEALPTAWQRRLLISIRAQVTSDLEPSQRLAERPHANLEDRIAAVNLRALAAIDLSEQISKSEDSGPTRVEFLSTARAVRDAIDKLLEEEPRLVRLYQRRHRLNQLLGQASQATESLARLLEINPHSREGQLQVALEAAREATPERIVALLREVVRRHPDHGRAHFFLCQAQHRVSAPARDWLASARRAVGRFPSDEKALDQLIRAVAKTREREDIATLGRIASGSGFSIVLRCRALQVLAHYLPKRFAVDQAQPEPGPLREVAELVLEAGRPIFEDASQPRDVRRALSGVLLRASQTLGQMDTTLALLLQAIALDPGRASHTRSYLLLMKQRSQTREAMFELHDLIEQSPVVAELAAQAALDETLVGPGLIALAALERQGRLTPFLRHKQFRMMLSYGAPERALQLFDEVIREKPLDASLRESRVFNLLMLDRFEEARVEAKTAGLSHGGTMQLDMIKLRLGSEPPERAIRLRDAIQLGHPQILTALRAKIHALAFQCSRLHEAAELAAGLQAALPDDPSVRFLRFFVLAARDPVTLVVLGNARPDEAQRVLAEALRRFPKDPALRWLEVFDRRARTGALSKPLAGDDRRQAEEALAELERAGERGSSTLALARALDRHDLFKELLAGTNNPGEELARSIRFGETGPRFDLSVLLRTATAQDQNAVVRLQAARLAHEAETKGLMQFRGVGLRFIVRTLELAPHLDSAVTILARCRSATADPKLLLRGVRSALQIQPERALLREIQIEAALSLGRVEEARVAAEVLRRVKPDSATLQRPELDGTWRPGGGR